MANGKKMHYVWMPREDQGIPSKGVREERLLSFYPYSATPNICMLNLNVTKETEVLSMTSSKVHKYSLPRAAFEETLPCLFLTYYHCRNHAQCSHIKNSNPGP